MGIVPMRYPRSCEQGARRSRIEVADGQVRGRSAKAHAAGDRRDDARDSSRGTSARWSRGLAPVAGCDAQAGRHRRARSSPSTSTSTSTKAATTRSRPRRHDGTIRTGISRELCVDPNRSIGIRRQATERGTREGAGANRVGRASEARTRGPRSGTRGEKRASPVSEANPASELSDPNGIRTRVTCVKGGCPRPLDDGVFLEGEPSRVRTCDPRLKRPVLYQLSYGPSRRSNLPYPRRECKLAWCRRSDHLGISGSASCGDNKEN